MSGDDRSGIVEGALHREESVGQRPDRRSRSPGCRHSDDDDLVVRNRDQRRKPELGELDAIESGDETTRCRAPGDDEERRTRIVAGFNRGSGHTPGLVAGVSSGPLNDLGEVGTPRFDHPRADRDHEIVVDDDQRRLEAGADEWPDVVRAGAGSQSEAESVGDVGPAWPRARGPPVALSAARISGPGFGRLHGSSP